jgi:RimJ/RimL family protein N-acetyltransferase
MSAPPGWLTTERLTLQRFVQSDFAWLCDLYADPDVTRHLGGPKTHTQMDEMMRRRILDYYEAHPGLGVWMTVERVSGAAVGFHLLNHIQGESIVQVGFTLAKSAWGLGYATEMGAALLRYAFADLGLPTVAGMATLENVASQRVLQKIGLERRGERAFPHPAYAAQGPMAWFEGEADAWLASHAGPSGPPRGCC